MSRSETTVQEVLDRVETETGVAYDLGTTTVSYTANKNDTEHFVDFVTLLFEEGLLSEEDLPYTPGHGKIRYLLNTDSVHQDGRDMSRPVDVYEGIYLETNHGSEAKKRYTRQMIEDFVRN